jgi:predicted phage terminase large subunit-like protein
VEKIIFQPQKGKQEKFLASSADICIYGGAAGGGKSYALLLEPLRHIGNKGFSSVTFRKTSPQIFNPGGLWTETFNIYSLFRATPKLNPKPRWVFPSGASLTFSHLDNEQTMHDWQGSQIPLIMFDELTHFTETTFFYMLSRNRSMCGVKPYVRATCNPDADSWVAGFISWWIDPDTGYPIEERCGKVRWFIRRDGVIYWANTRAELWEQFSLVTDEEKAEPRSVSFINSTLQDNKLLMQKDPSYISNLKALPEVERERLLMGNWKIKPSAGLFFKRIQVRQMLSVVPDDIRWLVRGWDLAATSETEGGDPAYTAGVLMGKRKDGTYIILDVINVRQTASDVRATIRHAAEVDRAKYKGKVKIRLPQDPGQAGKAQAQSMVKYLSGFSVRAIPESGSKETRAEPVASQWQAGNFDVVVADWNEMYFSQLESFPTSKFKDMVDATSSAFDEIENGSKFDVTNLL